ncbi:hypothetical protein OK016_19420 [Vibrio chagasii]|nr:hypothetical protein [Vibrio chagasii]
MQRAATSESLVKDPTAATTTINDDSDDHSELVSGCVSHRRREHHLHGDTDDPADWRGDGDAKQWCNEITIADGKRLQEPRRFQQVMMYT